MAVDTSPTTEEQIDRANATGKTPVVFIHGLWLLPSSWDRWAAVFEEAGYTALTPGWPDDPETVEEAKAHPEVFAHKTIGQVADHYEEVISGLEKKPAVIGHSFGGLLTQIVAGRGLSAASVSIDPAPFRGVLPLPISALKSSSPVLGNPANYNRAVPLTYEQFRYGFANAVSEDEAKELYESFAVPAPRCADLPGRDREPQSVDGGEGRHQESRPRAAPAHLRREGPHGPVGDRQRLLQEAEAQRGRDRDRRDAEPRARAHDRQRLAGGRRQGARVRPALRLTPTSAIHRRSHVPGTVPRTGPVEPCPRDCPSDRSRGAMSRGLSLALSCLARDREPARQERGAPR